MKLKAGHLFTFGDIFPRLVFKIKDYYRYKFVHHQVSYSMIDTYLLKPILYTDIFQEPNE